MSGKPSRWLDWAQGCRSQARSCTNDGNQSSNRISNGTDINQAIIFSTARIEADSKTEKKRNVNTISSTTRDLLPRMLGTAAAWTPWSPMAIDPRTVRVVENFMVAVSKSLSKSLYCCVSTCLPSVCIVSERSSWALSSRSQRPFGWITKGELSSPRRRLSARSWLGVDEVAPRSRAQAYVQQTSKIPIPRSESWKGMTHSCLTCLNRRNFRVCFRKEWLNTEKRAFRWMLLTKDVINEGCLEEECLEKERTRGAKRHLNIRGGFHFPT